MPLSDADKIINLEDLAAFKAKMDESVLHKIGTETVSGEKVFSGIQTTAAGNETALIVVKDDTLTKGETPETNHFLSLGFIDSTGDSYAQDTASRLGAVEYKSPSEANPNGYIQMADFGFNGGGSALLQVGHDKDNIKYATAPATSEDRTNGTDIVTRDYLPKSKAIPQFPDLWNWQKTQKVGVVAFKPVPESDLEPVVDFMFTETLPAEGERGPENPSTITSVSSVNIGRVGKNLLLKVASAPSWNGLSITANADGSYTIDGTFNAINEKYFALTDCGTLTSGTKSSVRLNTNKTYTISAELVSGTTSSGAAIINFSYSNTVSVGLAVPSAIGKNYISKVVADYVDGQFIFRLTVNVGAVFDDAVLRFQLEEGTEATDFEPPMLPADANHAIDLGGTYYGGSLDVATGVMTVTWYGEYLPTPTTADLLSETVRANGQFTKAHKGASYSTVVSNYGGTYVYARYSPGSTNYSIQLPYETLGLTAETATVETALAAMQDFLIAHPCFVVYTVNVSETVQLTPTQIKSLPALDKYEPRINTVYSDQEAVQVGYQRFYDENRIAAIEARLDALEGN